MRSRTRRRCSPPLTRQATVYSRLPAGHAHPDPARAMRRRCTRAPRPVTARPALPRPRAGTLCVGPSTARFRRWSRTLAARAGHNCGPSRWRIPAVARMPCRYRPGHSGRAESGRAPPRMRRRGPARPRRTGRPVAWPCRVARRPAGAKHPYEGPVSRLLPRSRGRPQVVPVSER
jgi:hypothetical protein